MADSGEAEVNCDDNPTASLVQMFVEMIQRGRLERGQCPARRPVFLKPHGVAHGVFRILSADKLPTHLRIGLFQPEAEYPAWVRFSSDTLPTVADFKTTVGVGLKLFDTPTPKIFGDPSDRTFDFIFQNMDVFFVDTAKDMCEFTKAGVVDGNYQPYLDAHPKTARILDEMQKPVGSLLATDYWAILPFALGTEQFVKYRLEPSISVPPPTDPPADPTYLAKDLEQRLAAAEAKFTLSVQCREDPETMPLDAATVRWDSPFVPVAELVLPAQDLKARGQAEYGENLSYNIWRVTAEHAPASQSSIAAARKVVYAASAQLRRDVNGLPDGEPAHPKPAIEPGPCVDDQIVRAAIHPAIGIARVGDSKEGYFIGPEVAHPVAHEAGYYRDDELALKRQAARFRIYGCNAAGEVVRELTAQNADIEWTVQVANRKADWYRFITAMDIPETADLKVPQRNALCSERDVLAIAPEPGKITGASATGPTLVGTFKQVKVALGELRTDEAGRLLFLGGHGRSESPGGAPPYDESDPDSFNNADDWFDDISDGPVDASVSIDGRSIPVDGAWVVAAPPNYAPDVIGWRTLYDLLVDLYTRSGWMSLPETTSFTRDILPTLARLSNLQWVNKGFATMFGKGGPMDFEDPSLIARLAAGRDPDSGQDTFRELRQQIVNAFRPPAVAFNDPRIWPWIYGDDFGGDLMAESPRTMLELPSVLDVHLSRWASGNFVADWDSATTIPRSLQDVPLSEQPAMLDRAALDFCLADAFHPGCELTWPMRHISLYSAPFRIRRRPPGTPETDYGPTLDQQMVLSVEGPLHAQGPGGLTRWMGLPWQGDTAYCRSGYDPGYDPYLPTFWPARVPNQVLTEDDYRIVIDDSKPRSERLAAYNRRASWYRFIDKGQGIVARMERMIAHFGAQGIVEARKGVTDDPELPAKIYVETLPPAVAAMVAEVLEALPVVAAGSIEERIQMAGWGDAQHLEDALRLRSRRR